MLDDIVYIGRSPVISRAVEGLRFTRVSNGHPYNPFCLLVLFCFILRLYALSSGDEVRSEARIRSGIYGLLTSPREWSASRSSDVAAVAALVTDSAYASDADDGPPPLLTEFESTTGQGTIADTNLRTNNSERRHGGGRSFVARRRR